MPLVWSPRPVIAQRFLPQLTPRARATQAERVHDEQREARGCHKPAEPPPPRCPTPSRGVSGALPDGVGETPMARRVRDVCHASAYTTKSTLYLAT